MSYRSACLPPQTSPGRGLRLLLAAILVAAGTAWPAASPAADWQPGKNVELIAGAGPGAGIDITARTLQKIVQDRKLMSSSVTVINKPGGGGAVAWNYLNQHAGDGHFLAITVPGILTNHITGKSPITYTDITPVVQLLSDYVAWTVRADSPIRSGRDLVEKLRADPASVSIAVGIGLGTPNHIASVLAAKAAGIDIRKLKFVVLNSSGESIAAALGGHVDVVASSPLSASNQIRSGQLRPIAVSSPSRLDGLFSSVPTWKEQGIDVVLANWRGVIGPKGMSGPQVSFWENVFASVTASEEWIASVRKNLWENTFTNSEGSRRFLESQYKEFKSVLSDLGLAR